MKRTVSRGEAMTAASEEIRRWEKVLRQAVLDNDFDVALEMAFLTFWRRVFALLDANRMEDAGVLVEICYLSEMKRYAKIITDQGHDGIAALRRTLEAKA